MIFVFIYMHLFYDFASTTLILLWK